MERKGLGLGLTLCAVMLVFDGTLIAQQGRRFPLPRSGAGRIVNSASLDRPPAEPPSPAQSPSDGVLLIDEAGTPLRLTLSGVGHIRMSSPPDAIPYPIGWESALTIKAQPNKSLWVDVRLDMNQQRIGDTYGSGQLVYPQVSATWMADVRDPEFFALTTRVGDLRKMTAGKGLFYKDQSEDGVAIELKGKTQSFSIAYLMYGLVASSDVVIAEWRNADRTFGVYGDYVRSDALGSTPLTSRLGFFGRVDIGGMVNLDWEAAGLKYSGPDDWGSAILIAPSKEFKFSDLYIMLAASYRGYYGATISGSRAQLTPVGLATVRADLFDEDLDWESYRSILSVTDTSSEIQSAGVHLKVERLVFGNWWVYGDYEWTRVMPHTAMPGDYIFWSTGLKAALTQHHYAYTGIQTKFLTDTGVVNGKNNSPYLAAYDPTWVAGVKFKF